MFYEIFTYSDNANNNNNNNIIIIMIIIINYNVNINDHYDLGSKNSDEHNCSTNDRGDYKSNAITIEIKFSCFFSCFLCLLLFVWLVCFFSVVVVVFLFLVCFFALRLEKPFGEE